MLVAQKTYAGTGSDNLLVSLPFKPAVVHIRRTSSTGEVATWVDSLPVGNSLTESGALQTDAIKAVSDAGVLTLGTNAAVNVASEVYLVLALGKDDGATELQTGSYAGNDTDPTAITVGFDDTSLVTRAVWLCTTANVSAAKTDSIPTDKSVSAFASVVEATGRIKSLDINGFTVSDHAQVNVSGKTFYWYAIATSAHREFSTVSIVGDGVDGRRITSAGFKPDAFLAKSAVAQSGLIVIKDDNLAWGLDAGVGSDATAFDQGESNNGLDPDGIQVGTSSRINPVGGATIYFWFFQETTPVVVAPGAVDPKVGHGVLGLAHGLRPFSELVKTADASREPDVELRLGKIIDGFVVDQGDTYVASAEANLLGYQRDIVGVRTFDVPSLLRVESLALVRSTPGSYFYDLSQLEGGRNWDDGGAAGWDERILDVGRAAHFELADNLDELNGVDALTINGSANHVAGLQGNCARFDETIDWSMTATHAETNGKLDFGANDFAIFAKVRLTTTGQVATIGIIADKIDGVSTQGFALWQASTSDLIQCFIGDGVDSVTLQSSGLSDTNWHSIAAFRLGDRFELYIDGVLEASDENDAIGSITNDDPFRIGGTAAPADSPEMEVDQLVFYGPSSLFAGQDPQHHVSAASVYHNSATSTPTGRLIPSTNNESWDTGAAFLYVHLPGGDDVSQETVLASFGFYLSTVGVIHPSLGPALLTDGSFEQGNPALFSLLRNGGGMDASLTVSSARAGLFGLRIRSNTTLPIGAGEFQVGTAPATNDVSLAGFVGAFETIVGRIPGAQYRISGRYRTTITGTAALYPIVAGRDSRGVTVHVSGRGEQLNPGEFPTLVPTNGEWRDFAFDFSLHVDATTFQAVFGLIRAGGAIGTVDFDDVHARRIFSWHYREPRLKTASLPQLSTGVRDPHFGKAKVGSGTLSFINSDGAFDPVLSGLEWLNQEVVLRAGGRFSQGERIRYDHMHPGFFARAQEVPTTDREVSLRLQDARTTIHRPFPPNRFSAFVAQNLDPRIDGKVMPVLVGAATGVPVNRIGLSTDLKPTFLLADPLSVGLQSLQAVYAYTSEAAADLVTTTERVTLVDATDFSKALAAGTITLLRDIGPTRFDDENQVLDFVDDVGTVQALITPALYASFAEIATEIASVMTAASADVISCTYSETTHKLTISSDGTTFTLKISSGVDKDRGAWKTLGFDTGADRTGATSYVADDPLFEDVARSLHIRADVSGLADNAAGDYSGTGLALIAKGVDLFALLWQSILGFPLSQIESIARADARANGTAIKAYFDSQTTTGEIFETLERTDRALIVIEGSGAVRYSRLVNTVPGNAVVVSDRDILSFDEGRTVADSYATVRVLYDRDPSTGAFKVRSTDNAISKLLIRPDEKDFVTYLTVSNVAQTLADQYSTLAASRARVAKLFARGLADEKLVGEIIVVSRARAPLAPGGANVLQAYRIRDLKIAILAPGATSATLVEHISVPGG